MAMSLVTGISSTFDLQQPSIPVKMMRTNRALMFKLKLVRRYEAQ
jgi:hypothetical protein